MTISRRTLLGTALAGAALKNVARAKTPPAETSGGGERSKIHVPNGSTITGTLKKGVRVYHLVAEEFEHEIAPGLTIKAWGYNKSTPGPVIEGTEGERVRIYVTNKLPEATTIHWHGVFVPNGMDGVAGLTQPAIAPGKTFKYEFVFDRAGTFMYHPHSDEMTQMALGMMGMIVVHPRGGESHERDYALMTHEMFVPIGAHRADPLAMTDFNVLTFNGKSFPATEALVARVGDRVRIRIGNLGPMDHHPIHFHGHAFEVVATDGGVVPPSARVPETTVLVPVGTVRVIEFIARQPGDWPLHCHMTHHAMNQMGHAAANLVGTDPRGLDAKLSRVVPGYMTMGHAGMSEMSTMRMPQPANAISMVGGEGPHGVIDMGGMFTLVKIRDSLSPGQDPGWYRASSTASEATSTDLLGDDITP
ncbi:MAG: copper oxidase [Kofleriaceae bacterium]